MKHKIVKEKILTVMMNNNPENVWVHIDYIRECLPPGWYSIVSKICRELVKDGILTRDFVILMTNGYQNFVIMYKINSPYIEKFRNVET